MISILQATKCVVQNVRQTLKMKKVSNKGGKELWVIRDVVAMRASICLISPAERELKSS